MKSNSTERYFIFILLLIVIVITLLIVYPFLAILILSAAFAVAINPIYHWIKKHIVKGVSWAASVITIILFLAFICTPLFFIGRTVFIQAQNLYQQISTSGGSSQIVEKINTSVNNFLPEGINFDIYSSVTNLISNFTNSLAKIFSSVVNTVIMLVLTVFILFYLLKDGEKWQKAITKILPLSSKNSSRIFTDLRDAINRIFRGSFVVAIAQGTLAWVGYLIFGIPNATIWAILAAFASFVPTFGTSIVTIPAVIYLFSGGHTLAAIGLLLWHFLLVATIDNVINPYIVSRGTEIPSLFFLLSILGAIMLIGPIGLIMGPLVISLLYSLVSIYKEELDKQEKSQTETPAT